jgi:hypothetical protein
MATLRVTIATSQDSVTPVDRIMITPHFVHAPPHSGLEAFVDDVIAKWSAYCVAPGNTGECTVKVYDAADVTPPNYPLFEKTVREGVAPAATQQRETAMCLSYYAGFNRPRFRGRLYVPCSLVGINVGGARPTGANQTKTGDLAAVLASMGGTEYQWGLWSRIDKADRPVTHWWVDNSWDHQRRRGVRPTSRISGTTTG